MKANRKAITAPPQAIRQVSHRHPRATHEAVLGLLAYHDEAVAFVVDPEANRHPNLDLLLAGLPQGPIPDADSTVFRGHLAIAFIFEPHHRVLHHTAPSAFLVLRALCLFEGMTTEAGRVRAIDKVGLPILAPGFTFMRLLANADAEEEVRSVGEEGDLWPEAFRIERGRHLPERRREQAVNHALRQYERDARTSDLPDIITIETYEALLKGAFRLFDAEHGKHFLRPLSGR